MNTFMNAARILVVTLLFVSLASVADCGKAACAPKAKCATGCKLQPEPVKIRKTCDHPGYYKQVCHLEYVPCEGKVEEHTMMPIYQGCFDEQGNRIDGNGVSAYSNESSARVVDVPVSVSVPSVYEQGAARKGREVRNVNNTRATRRNGNRSAMIQ